MAYVIGIDTGGTYTDTVLLDSGKSGSECIKRKAKAITTHDQLEVGIRNSILGLGLTKTDISEIDKVVLSTTLATNAIVEGKIGKIGLLMLGGIPVGDLATKEAVVLNGKVNIKGRIIQDIDKEEVRRAVNALLPRVEAFAISGQASVRNPILEQKVKAIVNDMCKLPVVCGHELVSELGYLERTNTAVVNAGLLRIIDDFIKAIKTILDENGIYAPVFVVKGDGTITKIDSIRNTPVDTVLSGPASSIIGAIHLTEIDNAVVVDMGGTTTDIGVVRGKRVELSQEGAVVGDWKIRIKSAKLYTYGLGGDSAVQTINGEIEVGPERVLPSCRGGNGNITPTDILHYSGEFVEWNQNKSIEAIKRQAQESEISEEEYVEHVKSTISDKIYNNLKHFRRIKFPVVAIGAPSQSWYKITQKQYDFNLLVPNHYEVANAVGAATSGVNVEVETIIRKDEGGCGYLVHAMQERYEYETLEEAIQKGIDVSKEHAIHLIREQNLEVSYIKYECRNMYLKDDQIKYKKIRVQKDGMLVKDEGNYGKYLESQIKVLVGGKIFADV